MMDYLQKRLSGCPLSKSKSPGPLGLHEEMTFTKPLPGKLELLSILVGDARRDVRQVILPKTQERLIRP